MADEDNQSVKRKSDLTLLDGCGCLGDGCIAFAPALVVVIWLGNVAWSLA